MRDVAMEHGIQMFIMATGGSILADTEAAHLAQSDESILGAPVAVYEA